jgi:putative oxidoreductase
MKTLNGRFQAVAHNGMRIAVGLMFFTHGAQKLFGWFGQGGRTLDLLSRFGIAGVLETFGGLLIVLGLCTRPVAFVLAGQMTVAYFWMHAAQNDSLWWWANRGELAALYAWVFFAIAALGGGSFSVDGWLNARKGAPAAER